MDDKNMGALFARLMTQQLRKNNGVCDKSCKSSARMFKTTKTTKQEIDGAAETSSTVTTVTKETYTEGTGGTTKTIRTETVTTRSTGGKSTSIRTYMNHDDFVKRQSKFGEAVAANPPPKPIGAAEEKPKQPSKIASFFKKDDKKPKTKDDSSSSSDDDSEDFNKEVLKSHNDYRKKHGVPPLKLSKDLCKFAQEWASQLAKEEGFRHRPNNKFGENIYMKWSSDPNHKVKGHEASDSWYSEIKDHTFGVEPSSLRSGHFTQLVWKTSEKLGVGIGRSKSGKVIVVANYEPAGNLIGTFAANVPPPK